MIVKLKLKMNTKKIVKLAESDKLKTKFLNFNQILIYFDLI